MKICFHGLTVFLVFALLAPVFARGQAESNDASLGHLARNLRKNKVQTPPARIVVDNDNFSQVIQQSEIKRLANSTLRFLLGDPAHDFAIASPDVTCSLSFSAQDNSLAQSVAAKPKELPDAELAKLEGPAAIVGESLQVSVYNGTAWDIREITVSLTLAKRPRTTALNFSSARVVPASSTQIMAKRSDSTTLYHLKGVAAPNTTTVFQDNLGMSLNADQEWHWAIVQAKGIPPK